MANMAATPVDLQEVADDKELAAVTALRSLARQAERRGGEAGEAAASNLRGAEHRLASPRRSVEGAVRARLHVHLAWEALAEDVLLTGEVAKAERMVRDAVVLRTQQRTPMGEREAFVKTIEEEHEVIRAEVGPVELCNEISRCMNAYVKVSRQHFPQGAFVSKGKLDMATANRKPRVPKRKAGGSQAQEGGSDSEQSSGAAASTSAGGSEERSVFGDSVEEATAVAIDVGPLCIEGHWVDAEGRVYTICANGMWCGDRSTAEADLAVTELYFDVGGACVAHVPGDFTWWGSVTADGSLAWTCLVDPCLGAFVQTWHRTCRTA